MLSTSKNIDDLEEGEELGGYVVDSIEHEECDHPKRRWSLARNTSEHPPKMTGRCTVCGDEVTKFGDE